MVEGGPWASGYEAKTTNQRMEVTAAFEAVRRIPEKLEIISDSTYVVKCFTDGWWQGWIKRGWKNAKKEPIANRDLWEPFIELVNKRGDVTFTWVKGHSGHPMNDAADKLATTATAEGRGRSGMHFGHEIVASMVADEPGSYRAAARPSDASQAAPAAPVVVVTGHRPTELGGWDLANPIADSLRRQLSDILRAKKQVDPDLSVVTGLGLGAEMLAAEAALMAAVPYVAVLPFETFDARWPEPTRRRFAELRRSAVREVIIDTAPVGTEAFAKVMRARDQWLSTHGTEAIMIWDRSDKFLARLYDRFDRAFDGAVWVIEPPTA